jgi:competence CoiA-like predicted nuclease
MIWAVVNHKKELARPSQQGLCPHCNNQVLSRCGDIYAWHWAHKQNYACDSWQEPETYWHKHWKLTFGVEHSERIVKKDNTWHIADILTDSNVVIELQNSPIAKSVIEERELFYGEKMIWVINGNSFQENFRLIPFPKRHPDWYLSDYERIFEESHICYEWSYARKCWKTSNRHVFIDFGDDKLFWIKSGLGTPRGTGKMINKKGFIDKYGGDYQYYIDHKNE